MNGDCGQLELEFSVKGSCGPTLAEYLLAKLEITLPDLEFFFFLRMEDI